MSPPDPRAGIVESDAVTYTRVRAIRWGDMMTYRFPVLVIAAAILLAATGPTAAQGIKDRHAGYYYPPPASVEAYTARAKVLNSATRAMRIGFVINLVHSMRERPYPPTFDIFPKGTDGEKLIIVGNQPGQLDTVYRARALLATLTAIARKTRVFRQYKVETLFTFLDLLKMLGFRQITVSDGNVFAHQIKLK